MKFAVIGGSGLYELAGLTVVRDHLPTTPFGDPSDRIIEGRYLDKTVFFLPRHGQGHRLTPSEVPYAANIYALKTLGVEKIISISAVGSLKEELPPGQVVLADQFIDRTYRRRNTFFGEGVVAHVSLAEPTCKHLRKDIFSAAKVIDPTIKNGGTYICIEGPQFSSRAESELYRSWNGHLIGMTNATEAKLAREAGVCYASVCFVTDYDCWKVEEEPVQVEQVLAVLHANIYKAKEILATFFQQATVSVPCDCAGNISQAMVTAPSARRLEKMQILDAIINKVI